MPPQQLPPNLLTLEQLDFEYLMVLSEIDKLLKEFPKDFSNIGGHHVVYEM